MNNFFEIMAGAKENDIIDNGTGWLIKKARILDGYRLYCKYGGGAWGEVSGTWYLNDHYTWKIQEQKIRWSYKSAIEGIYGVSSRLFICCDLESINTADKIYFIGVRTVGYDLITEKNQTIAYITKNGFNDGIDRFVGMIREKIEMPNMEKLPTDFTELETSFRHHVMGS